MAGEHLFALTDAGNISDIFPLSPVGLYPLTAYSCCCCCHGSRNIYISAANVGLLRIIGPGYTKTLIGLIRSKVVTSRRLILESCRRNIGFRLLSLQLDAELSSRSAVVP